MKLKIAPEYGYFLVIAVVLTLIAISFNACKGPQSPGLPIYTVSFDTGMGSFVDSQNIYEEEMAQKPANPVNDLIIPGLYEGHYTGQIFDGWYLDGKEFSFDTPITGDINLIAKWSCPTLIDEIDSGNDGFFNDAIVYIKGYPKTYTIVTDRDTDALNSFVPDNEKISLNILPMI